MKLNPAFVAAALSAALLASPAPAQENQYRNPPPAAAKSAPDPTIAVQDTDKAMNEAIAEAQATLPEWVDLYRKQPEGYSNFVIKFPLEGVEHIWVTVTAIEGETFVGTLDNAPHAEGWSLGDEVRVPRSQISDWAYFDDKGVAHGYRTLIVLFERMDPRQVAAIKERFGWE